MIGDKTTIEIKRADWSTIEAEQNPFHCPGAKAIQAHFNNSAISFSGAVKQQHLLEKYKAPAIALGLFEDETIIWNVEGFVFGQDCTMSLTEVTRKPTKPVDKKWFLLQVKFYDPSTPVDEKKRLWRKIETT